MGFIYSPRRQEKESALDKVLKGVQIAAGLTQVGKGVSDVASGFDERKKLQDEIDLARQKADPNSPLSVAIAEAKAKEAESELSRKIKEIRAKGEQDRLTEQAKLTAPGSSSLAKAPAEVKNKVGLIQDALNNLDSYESAYSEGARPQYVDANTPIFGKLMSDTPITEATRYMSEAIGRLNSGGVIGKEELVTFNAMLPRPGDDDATASRKLSQFRQMLHTRLAAFGVSPDELKQTAVASSEQKKSPLRVPKLINEAVASDLPKPGEVQDGYRFRGGNPGDPKSWEKL